MASNGRFDYTIGFKTDDSGLKQARKALQEIQKLTLDSPGVSGMQEDLNQAKIAATELETALTKSFNVKMGTTSVAKLNQELKGLNLNQVYEDMKAIGPAGEAAFNKVAAQALKTNLQIKQGSTLLDKFGKTLWRNVEWLISGNLINSVTGIFTKAYGYTKNLDESLNNIRIVTGKGADEMARFGKEAQETAAKLGKGTTDITNASLIFYQQGLDNAEVNARTEVATKLANVSQQSAETTADQLTAVWNGFQAGTDELERYADIMTAIAASTASSSSELAGAISKVSSVAHTTGVDMEQLSAMISTVISVTRDSPETVGTAFKTIFARMDDLVEDGTDEFGVSLGRVSSHLAAMGIEILNEDGSLRDLGDTLTETGNKWKSYSREQQVAIAEQMGGKRQWNQVIALFDNWDKYKDALDVAKNSTGALQEQQDIYMESTQAHLQAVKTAWEGVYGELMTADNINTVADTLTKVLDTIKSIIQAMGGIKPILTQVAGLMIQAFSNQIATNVVRIADNIKKADYNRLEKAAQQSLTAQFGNLNSPLMKELTGYQKTILKNQNSMTEAQKQEYYNLLDARVEAENKNNVLQEENKELDQLLNKYSNLKNLTDKNGNLDIIQVDEAVSSRRGTLEQMADTGAVETTTGREISLGWTEEDAQQSQDSLDMVKQIDEQIAQLTNRVAELNQKKSESMTDEQRADLEELVSVYGANIEELQVYAQRVREAASGDQEANEALRQQADVVWDSLDALNNLSNSTNQAAEDVRDCLNVFSNFNDELQQSPDTMKSATDKIDQIKDSLNAMANAGILSEEQVKDLTTEYDNFGKTISQTTSSARLTQGFDQLKQKVLQAGNVSEQELQKIIDGLQRGVPQAARNTQSQVDNLKQSMKDFSKEVNFQGVIKNITSMFGAITQITGAIQSFKNLGNIWDNEDLTTGEKYLQTLQNVGMALPMLIGGITTFTQSLKMLTAEQTLSEIKQKTLIGLGFSEMAVREGLTIETVKETLAQQQQNLAESVHIGLRKALKILLLPLIAVKALYAKITGAETAAQWGLNAAIEANPIGALLTVLIAVAAIMSTLYLWLQKLADEGKKWATWLSVLISPLTGAIGPIIALVKKIKEFIEVTQQEKESQEKLQETFEKTTAANQEFLDTLNETEKASSQLIQNFEDYDSIYEAFQMGTKSVEEYKDALNGLIDQLDLTEEEAEQLDTLLRKANVTGDYSEVDEFVQEQKEEAYNEMKGTRGKVVTAKRSVAAKGIVEQDNTMDSVILDNTKNADEIVSKAVNSWAGEGLKDAISEKGIDFSKITAEDYTDIENLLTAEKQQELQDLIDNSTGAEKAYYLELYDAIYTGRMEAINQAAADSETFSNALDSNLLKFDSSTSEAVIQKNMQEYVNQVKDNIKKANPTLSDEEIDELAWKQAVDDALLISPDAEESITNIELFGEQTSQALTKAYGKYASVWASEGKDVYSEFFLDEEKFASDMDQANMAKVNDQLGKVGLSLAQLGDFSDLSEESFQNLMNSVMTGSPLSADAIEQISDEVNEADQAIAFANLDFDNLSQKGEEWYTKLKENKVSPSDLVDNKGYNELLEQVGALGEAFDSEELEEAIDIISHPDAHDVDELADAWEVANKYIAKGELKAPVVELDKALKDLKKNDVYKDGRHLVMTAELDVDEAEKKLDKFLDADRSIEVTIDTKMDEASEQLKTNISDSADLASKIGEGFTTSLDDLDELSAAFPGVLDGMTVLADGSIQLSQQAVDAAAAQAQQEINNEIDKQILKYKIQNDLLQYKKDKYNEALEAAANMQKTEYTNEEDLDKDITGLMDIMDEIEEADRAATLVAEDQLTDNMLAKWEEYYTNAALMNEGFTSTMIANMNKDADDTAEMWDAEKVKSKFIIKEIVGYTVDSDKGLVSQYETKVDNAAVHDYAQRVQDSIKERQAEIDKQMADNLNQIKILEAYKQSNATTWKNVGKATEDNTDAVEDNTDATEENAEAQAELIELLILEADIYHDINREISNLNRAMSRLQDQQDKLTGKALADNLQEQIDLLDKQVDAKERWLKTASTDLATKSLALRDYGVEFDENGEISNYKEMYDEANDIYQAKVDWYNSLSKEEQEEAQAELDAAEARKDALEGYIKDYEDVKDSIDDAVDDIQSYLDQKIEKQVSKWKIEFEVDFSEAERKRSKLEFQKYMAGIAEDDILGNATFSVQTLATYLGEHGDMAAASRQYQELLEMKRRFDAGDMTTIYGDNGAKLQEDLDAAGDKWMEISKTVKDIEDTIKNSLLDLYDKAAEKLEEQRNSYKAISDLLEHDISLIKLRFGEQSYGKISKLLQQQRDLTEKQLQSAIAERDYFYQQLQKALESDPEMKEEATKKLAEHYKTALATVGSFAEEMANILYTNFENTVNDLFASMMEKLSGEYNLDYMKKEWDNIKAGADDYYDTVNAAYEIEKYQLQLKKAISETNDTATQKKLTDLMNNQVKLMQNKDKLSKYDVERANALFDIEQKRAAWQEAQNNKSKMRLRRDSNGNYSYQFVSDENKTADSLQALADAQNSLYNLDKDAIRTNTEEIYSLYTEMYAAIEEDAKSGGEHIEEIRDYYFQRIDQKVQDHELLRQNYQSTTFEELSKLTGTAIDDYEQLTDIEKEALMLEQDPLWGTALMKSMSSSEAFMGTLESTTAQAISAAKEYIAAFDKTIDDIGTNWQEMAEGSQPMVDMLDNLTLSTDTLVKSLNDATQQLAQLILLLGDSPTSLSEAMNIFGTDFSKLMETMTQSAVVFENVSKSAEGAASAAAIVAKQQNESGGQSGGQAKANNGGQNANSVYLNSELEKAHTKMKEAESKAFGENEMPKVGDKVKYLGGFYYGDSYGGGRVGNRGPGGEVTVYAVEKDKPYPISVISDDSAFGWLRKDQIAKFDKGGYTGEWGPEGKVAILHEKEMVLNQDMIEAIKHYNQAIQEKIKTGAESTREKLVEKINRIQDYQNQLEMISILGRFKDTLELIASEPKNMNVDAHFPNVSTAGEIEKAFKNLTNITTQNTYTSWR